MGWRTGWGKTFRDERYPVGVVTTITYFVYIAICAGCRLRRTLGQLPFFFALHEPLLSELESATEGGRRKYVEKGRVIIDRQWGIINYVPDSMANLITFYGLRIASC